MFSDKSTDTTDNKKESQIQFPSEKKGKKC